MLVKCVADNTWKRFVDDIGNPVGFVNITISNDQPGAVDLLIQYGDQPTGGTTFLLGVGKAVSIPWEQDYGALPPHVKLASGSGPVTIIGIATRNWRSE